MAADLFCGAGGTSSGLLRAAQRSGRRVELLAVNHWHTAVETHSKNHPEQKHLCADLDSLNPRKAVPGGYLDLLWASPECTHHSNARGGKPKSDQSRATAWCVLRWAEALTVKTILLENVPEFVSWGPLHPCTCGAEIDFMTAIHLPFCLHGKPIKERKGEYFQMFISNLETLGYTVAYRLLVCADYGDPTTRKRLFLQARKGGNIVWPKQTHSRMGGEGLPIWKPARSVIDWSLKGKSIYDRKTPLAPNTLRRIYAGLEKYSGLSFVIGQQSGASPRSVDSPLPTIAQAGAISVVQPFLIGAGGTQGQQRPQSIDAPVGTIMQHDRRAVVEPYLVVFRNNMDAKSVDSPLPTVTTFPGNFGVAQPFLFAMEHASVESGDERRCYDLDRPVVTVTKKGMIGLVEPYLVQYHSSKGKEQRTASLDEPLPVQDTSNRYALA